MLKKLESMKMQKKLNFGYAVVISLMIFSGIVSILGLSSLYYELQNYRNAQEADTAVKVCRINVNVAARNILQMTLNEDESTYSGYKETMEARLIDLEPEVVTLKTTDVITKELSGQYADALNEWGPIGYHIIELMEQGKKEEAVAQVFTDSATALDKLVAISKQIDAEIASETARVIRLSKIMATVGCVSIVVFIIAASILAARIGKRIVTSILTPLQELEAFAGELSVGNLHFELKHHSDDEFGSMADHLRNAVGILSSYVDDISNTMQEFSRGILTCIRL